MKKLSVLHDEINDLSNKRTLATWFRLSDIIDELTIETWNISNLEYSDYAEFLVVKSTNVCIDIANNYLDENEYRTIVKFIEEKISTNPNTLTFREKQEWDSL
ncbi:MAG: hypothetical protein GX905_10050 [Bacteroidales bacterium]|nr:hypothetical protein [Bacteroidales bacterium]